MLHNDSNKHSFARAAILRRMLNTLHHFVALLYTLHWTWCMYHRFPPIAGKTMLRERLEISVDSLTRLTSRGNHSTSVK
jgi:hypothetical protein